MKLRYRKPKDWKYEVWEDFSVQTPIRPDGDLPIRTFFIDLELDGTLHVRCRYAWDGCSGPTWDDKTNMRGGLAHDALYQLMRMGFLSKSNRPAADQLLYDLCLEDGMWRVRAWAYYQAVRAMGGMFVRPRPEDNLVILEAA